MNKPPIITEEQMFQAAKGAYGLVPGSKEVWKGDVTGFSIACRIAHAQRDADLAWLCEEIEKALLTDTEMSETLCPYEEVPNARHGIIARTQLQKILSLLQGDDE